MASTNTPDDPALYDGQEAPGFQADAVAAEAALDAAVKAEQQSIPVPDKRSQQERSAHPVVVDPPHRKTTPDATPISPAAPWSAKADKVFPGQLGKRTQASNENIFETAQAEDLLQESWEEGIILEKNTPLASKLSNKLTAAAEILNRKYAQEKDEAVISSTDAPSEKKQESPSGDQNATPAAASGKQQAAGAEGQQPQRPLLQESQLPNPSDVDFVPPLIKSMVDLCRLHGKAVSPRQMAASLPKSTGEIPPSACIRAAREAGVQMATVYRPSLAKITTFTLPCILLLKEGQSCVLLGYTETQAQCIFPENDAEQRTVARKELEARYLGYAIFAKPEQKLDARASNIQLLEKKEWFWGTLAYFMPIYKHVVGASIVVNLLAVCGPLFFMTVYDRVVPNKATDTLWMLATGIVVAYMFDFFLRNLRSYFTDIAGHNADVLLASRLMRQLLFMRLDVKPDSTGSLANNMREFESLRDFFGSTTLMTIVDLPFLAFFVLLIFFIAGPVGIIPLAAIPIVVGVGLFLQRPLQDVTEKGFKENMQKNALLFEIIGGLEAIKATMAEGRIQHAWENVVGMSAASNAQSKRMANFSMTMTMVVTQLVSVCVIIWGVYLINSGDLSMGGLIAANMLAGRAMAPLSQVASMLTRLQQSRMALLSLNQLMKLETEAPASGEYVEFGYLEHSIRMESVSFKYPNTERFALEGVSLNIQPGEKVGIIGRMGSGKTTFGRLCVGFYQPTEGAVKFGEVDLRQMDSATLRSRVGYVSQDNYLFYGTVRENISFGSLEADDRMILRAANIAGVTDFVKNHPAGFGMPVGERGMSLSGGQRQSIAIARALLPDPDVLILDEPSSNMDNGAENDLKNRLKGILSKEKTIILITHRLSMLTLVDRLIVVNNGKIFADGPKEKILKAAGVS